MIKLRDYQEKVKQKILESWGAGAQNVCVQMSTGAGKTVLFCNIISEYKGYSITIAHRNELVSQISLTLARYGIYHNIIAQKQNIKTIIQLHLQELKKSFFDTNAKCFVAGIDTLIKLPIYENPWLDKITLVVQDEAHHVLKDNKWGTVADFFSDKNGARGLYPSATPLRADGYGLGRHHDGLMDELVVGPTMRQLIQEGYLTDYRIFAPPSNLDLSQVNISASGDYSPPKLRTAVRESRITGDVVKHYKEIANGKLGVTFAVDIESATQIAQSFREAGVTAEVISSHTPNLIRAKIMNRFRNREILQLVNVDILGEGVDVPAIEVVSMARPTQSYAVYAQQFGRALRPMPGKTHAIIIDHVGNTLRHGLPDAKKRWSLDRRERKFKNKQDGIPLKTCLNGSCFAVYERTHRVCPMCGFYTPPQGRSAPEFVDGDLTELDEETLAQLRGEIERIDDIPRIPHGLSVPAELAIRKRHKERQAEQESLRAAIAVYAGILKKQGDCDSIIYRKFYFTFGIDVLTAQTLNAKDAQELNKKILEHNVLT